MEFIYLFFVNATHNFTCITKLNGESRWAWAAEETGIQKQKGHIALDHNGGQIQTALESLLRPVFTLL